MHIDGKTRLVGIIGWPVAHSFSPAMHNAAFAALGLNWAYVPLPLHPDAVATAVSALSALGFRGVNVTVPHKQTILRHLDTVADGARAIGAVNTVVFQTESAPGARAVGHNTDWAGFLADLAGMGVEIDGRDCIVLGAGGSARAVAYALAHAGGRVQVLARRPEQAAQLVGDLAPYVDSNAIHAQDLARLETAVAAASAPLIVNTTPLGMSPRPKRSVWPDDLAFPRDAFAYDLVYNPAETRFMQQARSAGCEAANGLGMLLHQGALAFRLWTAQDPDLEVMRAALGSWD